MSRRDQLFQAVNSVQGQVYGFIDQHVGSQAPHQQAGPSTPSGGPPASSLQRTDTGATLPLYSRTLANGAQPAPPSVLNSAPGHAQSAADRLPQNVIAYGTGREARAAAAALREEQLRTGVLKTKHTYISSGARVVLDIDTVPQRMLTFMGGTEQRGRGAMKGSVTIHAQPNERISAIRLKIKAVVRVSVPRTGTPQQPSVLDRTHPQVDHCVDKEVLLLQLESQLYDAKQANSSSSSADPTIMSTGRHEFPFTIDIPSQTSKGVDLPPSFVLSPLNTPDQVSQPQPQTKWDKLTSAIPTVSTSKDWASVKWYVKLTIERPGMLRTNERIFAPFVYLPPPPSLRGMPEHLAKQLRLATESVSLLRRFHQVQMTRPIDLDRLSEPLARWEKVRLPMSGRKNADASRGKKDASNGSTNGKKSGGLFSKILFGSTQTEGDRSTSEVRSETFTLHLPKKPSVFSLRSGIPFIISRSIEWTGRNQVSPSALTRLPNVSLFQTVNLYARGRQGALAATTTRFVASGRQPPDNTPVFVQDERTGAGHGQGQLNRRTEYWLGLIDLPPACTPCFETPAMTLTYFVGVRTSPASNIIHSEPVVLVCPPSMPVRVPLPTKSATPSRTGTPVNSSQDSTASSRRRRQESSAEAKASSSQNAGPGPSAAAGAAKKPPVIQSRPSHSSTSPDTHGRRPAAAAADAASEFRSAHATALSAAEEKRAAQARYAEQERAAASQQASSSSSSQPSHANVVAPPPPPRPAASSVPSGSTHEARPSATNAPLTIDDDEEALADQSNQWQFQDDELADLPPSYFEATGLNDE